MIERVALSPDTLSLLNAAPASCLVLLPDAPRFTIVAVTDAYLQAICTRREQLVGQSFPEVFSARIKGAANQRKMKASLEQALQLGQEHCLEEQCFEWLDPASGVYADKVWRVLHKPVLDSDGTVQYLIHSVEDVTDMRQMQQQMAGREERLRASEQLIKATLDASQDMIQVFRAVRNNEEKIIDFEWILNNHASEAYYGDVIGKRLLEHNPGVVTEGIFEAFVQVTETGTAQQKEHHYVHEQFNGWFYQTVVMLGDGVVMTTRDITAQKRAEQEVLRLKEEVAQKATDKYHALFYHMEDGFCIIEVLFDEADNPVDYRFLEVNPVFEKQTGIKDAAGKTMRQLQPNHEEHWFHIYGQVAKTGEPVHFENEAVHLAGGVWYDVYAFPVGPSPNHRVAILFNDITERKKAEEALRKSEEQFRLLVTASSDMVYRMKADWSAMCLLEGKRFLTDTEASIADWRQKYIPAGDLPFVDAAIDVAIQTTSTFSHEHRVLLADGSTGWVFSRAVPVLDENGTVTEWLGAASDITARKKAEQQLLEFNELLERQVAERTQALADEHYFLEQVTDKSPHLIYVFDLEEQCFTYINKRVEQLIGRDQEYVYAMGSHLFQAIIHPADLVKREAYMNSLANLNEQEVREQEFRVWTGNSFRWFRSKDSIFKKEDSVVKQVIGLAEDVTYEKMLQEKIQHEGGQLGLN